MGRRRVFQDRVKLRAGRSRDFEASGRTKIFVSDCDGDMIMKINNETPFDLSHGVDIRRHGDLRITVTSRS